jgi:hypothetical protein
MSLQVHPALGIRSENSCEPKGSIRRDGTLSGNDFADSPLRYTHGLGELVLSDTYRLQKILQEYFTRMYWRHLPFHGSSPSMVIDDLDIVGVPSIPPETDAPLIVDANAPLSFSFPSQFLQPVGRWDTEEIKAGSSVNQGQFSNGGPSNIPGESRGKEPAEYFQGFLAPECFDKETLKTRCLGFSRISP